MSHTVPTIACTQRAKLVARDAADGDRFGESVAISGTNVAIGAPLDDTAGEAAGSAYVFRQSGSTWSQTTELTADGAGTLDYLGHSVAISGDTIVAGAYGAQNDEQGAAYVFERTDQRELTAPDAAPADHFGHAVAIDGKTVVITAPDDDQPSGTALRGESGETNAGSAHVFELDQPERPQKLFARNGTTDDRFGAAAAIDGDQIVVAALRDPSAGPASTGSVHVFERGGGWQASDVLTNGGGQTDDQFGYSVAIRGDTIVVGAPHDDQKGNQAGAVYVFRSGRRRKLVAGDGKAGDQFGHSVAIRDNAIVVGAVAGTGSAGTAATGSAYLFERRSGEWSEICKMAANDGTSGDQFGYSVAIDGRYVAIGAVGAAPRRIASGSVYIFWLEPLHTDGADQDDPPP